MHNVAADPLAPVEVGLELVLDALLLQLLEAAVQHGHVRGCGGRGVREGRRGPVSVARLATTRSALGRRSMVPLSRERAWAKMFIGRWALPGGHSSGEGNMETGVLGRTGKSAAITARVVGCGHHEAMRPVQGTDWAGDGTLQRSARTARLGSVQHAFGYEEDQGRSTRHQRESVMPALEHSAAERNRARGGCSSDLHTSASWRRLLGRGEALC